MSMLHSHIFVLDLLESWYLHTCVASCSIDYIEMAFQQHVLNWKFWLNYLKGGFRSQYNEHILTSLFCLCLFIWYQLSFNCVFSFCLQVVFWLLVPKLLREEKIKIIMTIMLLIFLFQFLPKVYHSICMMRRMQKVTGYIFGTIWWGFGLNLIAYFIASHVSKSHNWCLSLSMIKLSLNSLLKSSIFFSLMVNL